MRSFIHRHLDPADRLGEILFGLIMALGFTGAVRLGTEQPDSRELFVSILGCNLAWGIVDGVMFAMLALFERGQRARLIKRIVDAPTEDQALRFIGQEFDDRLDAISTPEQRQSFYRQIIEFARNAVDQRSPGLHLNDLRGALAVALLIMMATFPVLVPFLIFRDPETAVRVSNLTAVLMLFILGTGWGRMVGVGPWRVGAGVAIVGVILVLITIALGG